MATHHAELSIKAPVDKVFAALTQPELMQQWQHGRIVTTDWQIGGPIRFSSAANEGVEALEQWGEILDFRPDELIKYRLVTPKASAAGETLELECITSYVLHSAQNQTRIELIQQDYRPAGFVPVSLQPILQTLRRFLEAEPAQA